MVGAMGAKAISRIHFRSRAHYSDAGVGSRTPIHRPARHSEARHLAADIILPSQFYRNLGSSGLSSEQRLMLAVLADAINILKTAGLAAGARKRQLYVEAERWVFAAQEDRVFSFDYVCDALQLDAQLMRRRLSQLRNGQRGRGGDRLISSRLRLKDAGRSQRITVNRIRVRRHRAVAHRRRR
jgi:hypothetical protein